MSTTNNGCDRLWIGSPWIGIDEGRGDAVLHLIESYWATVVRLLWLIQRRKILFMATVQEIERAIERLPETERNALESRLLARRCGLSSLNDEEQAELLRSLDEAEREIDEGRSYNTDEMRQALRGWLGK